MTKNITLKVDAQLLNRARHYAVDKHQSLSSYVSNLIEQTIRDQDQYESARASALEFLHKGFDLGGQPLTRDQLHER